MRATLTDVRKRPSWLPDWWLEFPPRRARFWRTLLFDPGQGWLRWNSGQRVAYEYLGEGLRAPEWYSVAPPLRRVFLYVRAWLWHPYGVMRGYVGWRGTPSLADNKYLRDPDRKKDLWS